jgi:hypothetical protein
MPAADADGLDRDLGACELRMGSEPGTGGGKDAAPLLRPDHLEWVAEAVATFLLDFDYDDAVPPPHDEVELVTACVDVRREQPVAAEAVGEERAALAPVHAAWLGDSQSRAVEVGEL